MQRKQTACDVPQFPQTQHRSLLYQFHSTGSLMIVIPKSVSFTAAQRNQIPQRFAGTRFVHPVFQVHGRILPKSP